MKIAYLFLFVCVLLSCSAFENENNEVTYRWKSDGLIVENGSSEAVYYAVFEQETLAHIFWVAVSTEENRILPNTFIKIDKDEVLGYEEGKKIVLFYWTGTEHPFEFFENVVIET
ncbi:MAG: hypothetical protein ABJR05_01270 [Balneola sp.]